MTACEEQKPVAAEIRKRERNRDSEPQIV